MDAVNEAEARIMVTTEPGMKPEKLMEFYAGWAEKYDKDTEMLNYDTYASILDEMRRIGVKPESRILEIACGTGILSETLVAGGYKNIDGLDASKDMLKFAREKKNYTRLIESFFGPEKTEGIENDAYDVVIGMGCFNSNHLGADCLQEIIRVTKPGGHALMQISHIALGKLNDFIPTMEKHEEEGRWKILGRTPMHIYGEKDGLIFSVQML